MRVRVLSMHHTLVMDTRVLLSWLLRAKNARVLPSPLLHISSVRALLSSLLRERNPRVLHTSVLLVRNPRVPLSAFLPLSLELVPRHRPETQAARAVVDARQCCPQLSLQVLTHRDDLLAYPPGKTSHRIHCQRQPHLLQQSRQYHRKKGRQVTHWV